MDEPCHLRVAFVGTLTGDNANIAIEPRDGAKLAIDRYNSAHTDCPVELIDYDTGGVLDQAAKVATEAAADPRVLAVIGPSLSGEAEAAVPVLDAAGVTTITPSATRTGLAEQGWHVFHRVVGNDAAQGPAAGRYVSGVLHARNVFVIDDAGSYGKGLADEVRKQLGSLVVESANLQPGQSDYSWLIPRIRASNADAVFYGGYYAEAGTLLRQIREAGLTTAFIAGDGVRNPGLLDRAGNRAAEGAVITCVCVPPTQAKENFAGMFQAAYGRFPQSFSAEAYDAAQILLAGIDAGNHTRASLLAFVNAYDTDGITGHLRFDSRGELHAAEVKVWAYRVVNGQIVADQEIR